MTYEATVQFKFDATFTPTYGSGFGSTVIEDYIPEEHYLITAPAADLNSTQYFKLFEKFLLCVGMCPQSIRSGAMSLVFNDYVDEKEQRKVCDEYELTMDEDLEKKYVDNVGRYSIFTQFTDEQLREMAEWGNQKYFMGGD
jgi:predicted ATP-dependent Lon-type protease